MFLLANSKGCVAPELKSRLQAPVNYRMKRFPVCVSSFVLTKVIDWIVIYMVVSVIYRFKQPGPGITRKWNVNKKCMFPGFVNPLHRLQRFPVAT